MLEVNFHPFPVLNTERLVLRRVTNKDAEATLQMRSDEAVMQYIDRPRATNIDDALQLIGKMENALISNEGITWIITLKTDDTMIGTIGFWRMDKPNYRAEIGYMINTKFQRQGLMQEAISATIDYAFNTMKLHSIEANVNTLNTNSVKILTKNKFKKEAHFRENYFYDGKFLDSIIYCLLQSDLQ